MAQPHILLIGDLKGASSDITQKAVEKKLKVLQVKTVESAIESLSTQRIEIAFLDTSLSMPNYFTALNQAKLTVPTIAVGPSQPVQNAVKSIRLGAIEYLSPPVDIDILNNLLNKISPQEEEKGLIAGDDNTKQLLEQAKKFANSNATVLLRGESGTGKEVFSRFIHNHSQRKDHPFISINCAAIPENLLESELFGHEKGAFSGALNRRIGKFQQADGGTLLLDEISEMDVALQTKLLRAIQERVIDPVGSTDPVPVDIRLIATTNRDLEKEVEKGTFREDLYFRLNVVMLEIPPLRERPGDILSLSTHFTQMYGEQNGIKNAQISDEAAEKLISCYWKGNVRELENTIHRAILMMGDEIIMNPEHIVISPMSQNMMSNINQEKAVNTQTSSVANAYTAAAGGFASGTGANKPTQMVGRTVQDVEKELILSTLDYCKGNRTHAADILGISIRTLRNKLKEYENLRASSAE